MIETIKRLILEFQGKNLDYISPRNLLFPILPGKATVITGMRRSGKSSFCYQKIRDLESEGLSRTQLLYLNFEDDRLVGFRLEDCQGILDAYYSLYPDNRRKECYFFFDEIQNITGWEHFIRRLLDTTSVHIILTGSSSKMLTTEIETAMRGRSISKEVLPFSFVEYLQYHHVFDKIPVNFSDDDIARLRHGMDKYFRLGGFPETFGCPDEAMRTEILQEYSDLVILRDVIERHKVSNAIALRYLLRAIYHSVAQKFSVTAFWKVLNQGMQVKCAKNDLYDFMNYLEEACIIYRTELFSPSEKAKLVNPDKVYLIDVGLVRAMSEDPEANRGWLLENLVYLHLRRQKYTLNYVNTSDGKEIDFYAFNRITRDKKLIQVTWSLSDPETRERELRPLDKAATSLGIKEKLVITWDEEAVLDNGIQVIPAWKFLASPCQ